MPATAAALPPVSPRAAFTQVVNRHSVAVVFLLAVLFVASRYAIALHLEPPEARFWNALRYLRQTLISGLVVLLAIGLAEAVTEGRRWRPALLMAVRGGLLVGAATLAALLRVWVAGGDWASMEWSWIVATIGIWSLNGALGHAVLRFAREERASRERLQQAAREHELLTAQGLEARLSALQAQIEPHFLFNTLAHVQRLYATEPGRGRDMLRSLIDHLRAALPSMRRSGSTLGRELELARSFLTILQLRMGERLAFEIRADQTLLEAPVPPMVLATLVENAVKHGLAPLPQGGCIVITAGATADGRLAIEVADNGQGFVSDGGSGVGLANTRSRLAALYGERASLSLQAAPAGGVIARVLLPVLPVPAPAQGPMPLAAAGTGASA